MTPTRVEQVLNPAANVLAAIKTCPPVDRMDALAVATRVALDLGWLDDYARTHQEER